MQTVIKLAEQNEFTYTSAIRHGWGYGNGQASVGAFTTIESATPKNIDIVVDIVLKSGATLESATNAIKAQIEDYLKTTVFVDSYVSYAQIGACILKADGVLDYVESTFTVNGAKDNVLLSDTDKNVEVAILKNLTVRVK